jgi:hypothetical protein
MTWCRFRSPIEDRICQEAKRWRGAIHQKHTMADRQSLFRQRTQNSRGIWPRTDCGAGVTFETGCQNMPVARPKPTHDDWVKTVLFDRGYLSRIPGEAIKVYLAIIEACGGVPDRSVTISLRLLMQRTELSCPTVIESLSRLEGLGLVVSTTRQRGRVKTYYVSDPPAA